MRPMRFPEGRVKLFDERRARGAILGDKEVDFISLEGGGRLRWIRRIAFATVALGDENRHVFDKVRSHRFDVLGDAGHVGKGAPNFLDEMIDGIFCGLAVQLPYFVAPLFVPARDLADDMFELLLERRDVGLHLIAFGLRPAIECVGWDDLAVLRRHHRESDWRAQQEDRFLRRFLAQGRERFELPLLERFVDCAAAGLIFFALESGGGSAFQVFACRRRSLR